MVVLRGHFSQYASSEESITSYLKSCFKRLEEETLYDFLFKRSDSNKLHPLFDLPIQLVLLSNEETNAIFQNVDLNVGWKEFYKEYPGSRGKMVVSRVGFNANQTQALACVGIQWGLRAGYGSYFLLEKIRGEWQVKQSAGAWRS